MHALAVAEEKALREALDDEYRSWATYDQVIKDFGDIRPFSNIREAEARHIGALIYLFAQYALDVPQNPWAGRVPHYASVRAACEAAVQAEIANGAMYQSLLRTTSRQNILAVLQNLQRASVERHLPAFRRCAERRGSGRAASGQRRRCGRGQVSGI